MSLIMYSIFLVLVQCLLICHAEDPAEILVSYGETCEGPFTLSSQTESLTMKFPDWQPGCDDSVHNAYKEWTCSIDFSTDDFTLTSFEMCFDATHLAMKNCITSHIHYESGLDSWNLNCSNKQFPVQCFGERPQVSMAFTASLPCSFHGASKVYLRPRISSTYFLFKENRPCIQRIQMVENNLGRIISEFNHTTQKKLDFCPLYLKNVNWHRGQKFCLYIEFSKYHRLSAVSAFTLTITTPKGREHIVSLKNVTSNQKLTCEMAHPDGYIISANLDRRIYLNDHRIRLKYTFSDDGHKRQDSNDDESDFPVWAVIVPIVLIAAVVGLLLVWLFWKRNKQTQAASHGSDAATSGTSLYVYPAGEASADNEHSRFPTDVSANGQGGTSEPSGFAEASAPLVTQPSASLSSPGDKCRAEGENEDIPPAYDSLFPATKKGSLEV